MWSQISLIIVLTFHLHACHDHNHSIHITEVSQAEQHDLDMSEFKVYRLMRREVLDPDAPRLSSGNLDRDSVHHSSAGAASDSGHGPGKNDDLESGLLGNESLPDPRINGVAGIHENIGHSLEAAKSNRQLFNDSRPISVISTVAVQELFDRYGDGQAMNIEGFQRLMVSLGLGNVSLDDEVDDARSEPASYNQESHDHDDESADHIKHAHNDGSPNQYRERRVRGTGARHAEGQIIGSKPKGKVKQLKLDSKRNIEEAQTNRKGKKRNKSRKSNRKQNKNKNEDKSQQERQSGSTDQLALKKRSLPEHKPNLDKCMTPEDLLLFFNEGPKDSSNFSLSQTNFIELCPVLIHQLDKRLCPTEHSILARSAQLHQDPHDSHDHDDDHHHDDDHDHSHHSDHDHEEGGNITEALSSGLFNASAKVWGYAFLSCLIISVVGLASVAIVPIMHKVIYNHLLQFLVALAIGSLTGDAFLHLLPHAVVPHNHDLHDNNNGDVDYKEHDKTAIWIGCVALGGIYFFLLAERIMGIVTRKRREHNRKKRKMRASPSRPYTEEAETHIGAKLSSHNDDMKSCEETLMVVHPNKGVCGMAVEAHDEVHQNCDPDVRSTWGLGQSHDSAGPGHHHSHEVPGSVASVAWMVIVGDGLHNFSDGLAIGAAFANGLTSGLSTSIAVFCHELPHELGDFAVLLRAGMSVKQALVYNCVSSILCLVGMVTGIAVGNLDAASQWIFALISGMFIYIALVDMLPEITNISPKEGENPGVHLILQSAGIITGAAIMLLIAIYEDRIQVPHWEP